MASAVITFATGTEAGAALRRLGNQIQELAINVPDRHVSGGSVTLTVNDAPGGGAQASVALAGPYGTGTRTIAG